MYLAHIEIRDLDNFDAWTPEVFERLFKNEQEAKDFIATMKKDMLSSERIEKEYIRNIED